MALISEPPVWGSNPELCACQAGILPNGLQLQPQLFKNLIFYLGFVRVDVYVEARGQLL